MHCPRSHAHDWTCVGHLSVVLIGVNFPFVGRTLALASFRFGSRPHRRQPNHRVLLPFDATSTGPSLRCSSAFFLVGQTPSLVPRRIGPQVVLRKPNHSAPLLSPGTRSGRLCKPRNHRRRTRRPCANSHDPSAFGLSRRDSSRRTGRERRFAKFLSEGASGFALSFTFLCNFSGLNGHRINVGSSVI